MLDFGTDRPSPPIDYPDKALEVGHAVASGRAERGVIVCGSGAGVSVAAGKIRGVRACTIHDHYTAHQGVEHDGVNVLCMGGRVIGAEIMVEIVEAFLGAEISYRGAPCPPPGQGRGDRAHDGGCNVPRDFGR